MKTAANPSLTEIKYFIIQENSQNAVGIIDESKDLVSFCNLTLLPVINHPTGKIEFKLGICPETAIRYCANPSFKNNVQIGIMRSIIDLTGDAQEVERVLKFNKAVKEIIANRLMQDQV